MDEFTRKISSAKADYDHNNEVDACLAELADICRKEAAARRSLKRRLTESFRSFTPYRFS